ncbi:unnamed protein product [Pleuronectes platessa]|uniref:Uncharacterized protein n=1 Tax=Pleuronectes platessa TaxID=8262 RepID=A0A9N7UCI1_PLEPL|nr:unnamed protein product [Pleuronectes platessa]
MATMKRRQSNEIFHFLVSAGVTGIKAPVWSCFLLSQGIQGAIQEEVSDAGLPVHRATGVPVNNGEDDVQQRPKCKGNFPGFKSNVLDIPEARRPTGSVNVAVAGADHTRAHYLSLDVQYLSAPASPWRPRYLITGFSSGTRGKLTREVGDEEKPHEGGGGEVEKDGHTLWVEGRPQAHVWPWRLLFSSPLASFLWASSAPESQNHGRVCRPQTSQLLFGAEHLGSLPALIQESWLHWWRLAPPALSPACLLKSRQTF